MRIIDKNTDFYDYLQNVYYDPTTTFDRTDSFVLTKEMLCEYLDVCDGYARKKENNFALLQVCNTFWLFLIKITSRDNWRRPAAYTIELVHQWKNYEKDRKLLSLDLVDFGLELYHITCDWKSFHWNFNEDRMLKNANRLAMIIDTGGYKVLKSINKHTVYHGDNTTTEKHIPLLKACGIGPCINPVEIFTSLEEYFSLEKQSLERTESIGITDKEKVENHGFDAKTSFRGRTK